MKLWTSGTAIYSKDRRHRYLLTRKLISGDGTALFIGLNPSTATAKVDDRTIRRCIGFAFKWGYGRLLMANAFALRSTNPKKLYTHKNPVGQLNDRHILKAARKADVVVVAWGHHAALKGRSAEVLSLLRKVKIHCLGRTKDGYPKHPLYLAKTTKLMPYRIRVSA